MKKLVNKIFILFIISFFLISPQNVFAGTPTPTSTPNSAENPYSGLQDLGSVHIEMDGDGDVSIKEIKSIESGGIQSVNKAWNFTFEKYRGVITGITGLCTMTFVLIFLLTFVKISSSGSNPHQRAELTKALIWIGIGAAGFGSVTLFLSLGFGLFKEDTAASMIYILNNFIK